VSTSDLSHPVGPISGKPRKFKVKNLSNLSYGLIPKPEREKFNSKFYGNQKIIGERMMNE